MKKYISKVSELVKHNTGAFFWIIVISAGFSTLNSFLGDYNANITGSSAFNGLSEMQVIEEAVVNPQPTGYYMLISLGILVFVILSYAFVQGGFLSYLGRGISEKNDYLGFYIKSGFKKMGRITGALFMQILMMLLLALGGLVVLAIPAFIIILSVKPHPMLEQLFDVPSYYGLLTFPGLIWVIVFGLIIIFMSISIIILTYFILFEAALTDGKVGQWVKNSFAKSKKVFWNMFLGVIIMVATAGIITELIMLLTESEIISNIVYFPLMYIITAFLFYPLYNLGTERLKTAKAEKIKLDRMDKELLETLTRKEEINEITDIEDVFEE